MLTFDKIEQYLHVDENGIVTNKELRSVFYDEAKDHAEEIDTVFSDEYPEFLNINRPREKTIHKEYRKQVFLNVVKPFKTKLVNMVKSIRQADDFTISWSDENKIKEETNTLKYYLENGIKKIGYFDEWFWEIAAHNYVTDPNGVFVVVPSVTQKETEYVEPRPIFIPSKNVVVHKRGEFSVLVSSETHYIKTESGKEEKIGKTLFIFDNESYTICKQLERKAKLEGKEGKVYTWEILGLNKEYSEENVTLTFTPPLHGADSLPCIKVGNLISKSSEDGDFLYKSIASDSLPFLKKVLQRDSDKEIELLQHIHTIEWFIKTMKCDYVDAENNSCNNGVIKSIVDGRPHTKTCQKCKGTGAPASGLDLIWVDLDTVSKGFDAKNEKGFTGAPAGYIPRNIDAVKELQIDIDIQMRKAYRTVDAEFLYESPLSTSGTSKSYDRQEYYRLLADIANHIVTGVYLETIYLIDAQRYGFMDGLKGSQVPNVTYPKDTFDLSTTNELLERMSKIDDQEIRFGIRLKIADREFGIDSKYKKRLLLKSDVDPFYLLDDKNKREQLLLELPTWRILYEDGSDELESIIKNIYWSLYLDNYIMIEERGDKEFFNKTRQYRKDRMLVIRDEIKVPKLKEFYPDLVSESKPLVDLKNRNQV